MRQTILLFISDRKMYTLFVKDMFILDCKTWHTYIFRGSEEMISIHLQWNE